MNRHDQNKAAGLVLRRDFPYGMIKDVDGKVVLFNRDYEALSYAGVKEFDFDPETLGISFADVIEGRYLATEDGGVYVGTFYMLYVNNSPEFLEKRSLVGYLNKLAKVMEHVVTKVGNAQHNNSITAEQEQIGNNKFKRLQLTVNN